MSRWLLDGQVAVVTGGARGIGHGIALELASHGAHVAILDVDADAATAAAASLPGAGHLSVACDVANAGDCDRAVADVTARIGRIDTLVNNAGIQYHESAGRWTRHLGAVSSTSTFTVPCSSRARPPGDARAGLGFHRQHRQHRPANRGLRGRVGKTTRHRLQRRAACQCAVFRSDLVDESALPGTWSQLSTWASEQHDPPGRYGLALCVERVQGTCLFLSLLASLGQVAFGETGAVLERDSATFVLQSVRDLLRFASRRGIDTLGHPGMCTSASRTTTDVAYCPALFGYVNYFGLERRGCGWG